MAQTALARYDEIDRYLAEVNRYPILSANEEVHLARQWRDFHDVEAAHSLVTANLRFVVKIAYEYKGYGAKMLDLIQEGSIGLMQAVKRFDPDRGYRLISYAVYWIRSYIHAFLMGAMRTIKIGTSRAHRKLFFKLRALKGKLSADGLDNRDDVIDAVAREVGVNRADVEEMDLHLTNSDVSLDTPNAITSTPLAELIPSEQSNQEEMLAEIEADADMAARLTQALGRLDSREREIVEKRYLSDAPVQLKDLGEQMGVTKQRVSQLERRAMKKLRAALSEAA